MDEFEREHGAIAMRILCFIGFCSVLSPGLYGQNKGLTVIHQWGSLEWTYTPAERQSAKDSGEFVPGNGVPIDVDVHYAGHGKNRIFVTVPKFIGGIPATLNTVTKQSHDGNPQLQPYPDWSWHRNLESCGPHRMISVFRIKIDECGRLWVLDTGKIGTNRLCHAQILAFDLNTDQLIHRYEVPDDQAQGLLVTPVVDVRDPEGQCADTFVYAGDVTTYGLVVYDFKHDSSWRVHNKLLYPYPDSGTFTINGESFDLMDGILGMAITPYTPGYDRTLFFHALASVTENYVSTEFLRNQSTFLNNIDAGPRKYEVFQRRRQSQSAAEAIDRDGIMHFGLLRDTAMACWNTNADYDQRNFGVVEQNADTLQFPSGVKIVNNLKGSQELWIVTCRFQKVMAGTMNPEETNFRVQAVKVEDFLRGSKCKSGGKKSNHAYGK